MALVLPAFALGAVYSDLDSSPEALASAPNEVVIGFDHTTGAAASAGVGGRSEAAAVVNGNDDDGSDNPSVPSSVTPQGYWNTIPSSSEAYSATVGDTLTFKYGGMHNVFLAADEAAWSSCSESGGEEVAGFAVGGGDEDYPNLYQAVVSAAGDYYFFCTAHTHCADGQKVKVSATTGCPRLGAVGGSDPPLGRPSDLWSRNIVSL